MAIKRKAYSNINLLVAFLILIIHISCGPLLPNIEFDNSSEDFVNPERGFYRHYVFADPQLKCPMETGVNKFGSLNPLSQTKLEFDRSNENISLILRHYYLHEWIASDLEANFITFIENDLQIAKLSGVKVILRFAYSCNSGTCGNRQEARLNQILRHISQLEHTLQDYSSVIALVQIGFIGTWGEAYLAHPDFMSKNCVRNVQNRKRITDAILNVLPDTRMVQLRAPRYKYDQYYNNLYDLTNTTYIPTQNNDPDQLLNAKDAVGPSQAYDGSFISRVGHFNDCFLTRTPGQNIDDDWGTYRDVINEKAYLEEDSKYVVVGGETCVFHRNRSECVSQGGNAETELERFHWSFIHKDFQRNVLNRWETGICMESIKISLGYRLELKAAYLPRSLKANSQARFKFWIENTGYAAPFNPRNVEIVLRTENSSQTYVAPLDLEPRTWLPGNTYEVDAILCLPNDMELGDHWQVFLNLPDPLISNDPRYSIRLAYKRKPPYQDHEVWDEIAGLNYIGNIYIGSRQEESSCPDDALILTSL